MPEDLSNPLLALIKEQGLIDDLQHEEVLGEFKRTGKPVSQILQDFGILDLDTILQAIAIQIGPDHVTQSAKRYNGIDANRHLFGRIVLGCGVVGNILCRGPCSCYL